MSILEEQVNGDVQSVPKGTVIIAGGGPVGLMLARVLSFYGVKSILFERNDTTTKWPKVDHTNPRSMELFRKLGLADDLRKQGVPGNYDQNVLISSGLSADKRLTSWDFHGVDEFRKHIRELNDGTQPQEPWQRISQSIIEKWLKALCDEDPLIDLRYGFKVESVEEHNDGTCAIVTNVKTGDSKTWSSEYLVGCDGASSRVRKSLSIPLDGGPIPTFALLIHFKSGDLERLYKQGRFWHMFLLGKSGGFEAAVISQDEKDTWTAHLFLPLDAEPEKIDSRDAVYRVLGGLYDPYEIKIDEILVRSTWRPNIAVARTWSNRDNRIFIAGDAAHQTIPTGGYGMNMGLGDAFDLGWKLASVINGQGGPGLLRSYEVERRPVALRNLDHSGVHFKVHEGLKDLLTGGDPRRVDDGTDAASALRQKIHEYYQTHEGEGKDFGIEMGYRYTSPVIMREEDGSIEPPWAPRYYTPTTWPGSRAPHLYLSDGTSIFDLFGKDWALVVFTSEDVGQGLLAEAAQRLSLPLITVNLSTEKLAKKLYERKLVLIRPDQHVAWRSDAVSSAAASEEVLQTVTGWVDKRNEQVNGENTKPAASFTMSVGMVTQVDDFTLEKMGDFQK